MQQEVKGIATEEFIKNSFSYAKEFYMESESHDGKLLMFAESKNEENTAMWNFGFADDQEKMDKLAAFGLIFKNRDIQRYVVMSLVWIVSKKEDQLADGRLSVRPSEDPDKQECMMIAYADQEGARRVLLGDVVRTDKGLIVDIVQKSDSGFMKNPQGEMTEILNFKYGPEVEDNSEVIEICERMMESGLVRGFVNLPHTGGKVNRSHKPH